MSSEQSVREGSPVHIKIKASSSAYLHSFVFSEAILALQSEVSRLKKDLEEGLVQLPHLAQKMDYLTSKYRQERRSKTRARSHHRPACNRWEADPQG